MTPVASLATRRLRQLRFDTEPGRRSLIESARSQRRPLCTDGGGPTLEDVLLSAWEGLLAVGAAECVICGSQLERSGAGGRCGACGTTLA
jgi:hypothetical protein